MADEVSQYRRVPALRKKIKDINPESDMRVTIVGTVVGKNAGSLIVDDGSDTAEIVTDVEKEIGSPVRIIARVLPLETRFELQAEIVQDMKGLNMNLYKLVEEK